MTRLATDAVLASVVGQAVAGDEVAFARVVAAYHRDLLRVAYFVCGDLDAAEDAAQAAWSIAWRKLGTVHDPARVRPWLVAVAANEARHLVRRRPRVVEIDMAERPEPAGDPSLTIERVDLLNALNRLKPDERSLLALRYAAGLDSTEISTLTGTSPSSVRGRLARLLARLRRDLTDE